ncbi:MULTISPECIES: RDD family protein [unclassified Streptomyces]|uniref:RDD family protein n=1 Tax=unclassified Streptomyces TaxID=2593676 RepID=UPI0036FBA42B
MSELVTGEAVALELRPARLPSRALAVVIDLIVAIAAYTVVTVALLVATASLDDAARTAVSIAAFLLVLVGAPIAVETLSHGRSLGKLACGLRVVRDDGGPIRFRHALVRGAVGVVEILLTFGVVACIASLVSERGRRLGDVFAGTLVVRERVPQTRTGFLPPPPPWLAGRFGQLDLSAVPDALWLAVRQYLSRMHQLDPQVGSDMAQRLAADLSARTGTPVPPGIPPAAYLAAVLQERQAREARRAFAHGPQAAGTPAAGAQATGPQGVGPLTTGPQSAGPPAAEPQAAGPFAAPLGPSGTPAPDSHTTSSPAPSTPPAAAPTPPPTESSESRPHTGFAPPA